MGSTMTRRIADWLTEATLSFALGAIGMFIFLYSQSYFETPVSSLFIAGMISALCAPGLIIATALVTRRTPTPYWLVSVTLISVNSVTAIVFARTLVSDNAATTPYLDSLLVTTGGSIGFCVANWIVRKLVRRSIYQ